MNLIENWIVELHYVCVRHEAPRISAGTTVSTYLSTIWKELPTCDGSNLIKWPVIASNQLAAIFKVFRLNVGQVKGDCLRRVANVVLERRHRLDCWIEFQLPFLTERVHCQFKCLCDLAQTGICGGLCTDSDFVDTKCSQLVCVDLELTLYIIERDEGRVHCNSVQFVTHLKRMSDARASRLRNSYDDLSITDLVKHVRNAT